MRRTAALLVVLLSTAFVAAPATAGQAGYGTAQSLLISIHNVAFFNSTGPRYDPPACVKPGLEARWAFNLTTDHGKAILSAVMTAQARGKQVFVNGTGTCSVWADTESIDYIQIED